MKKIITSMAIAGLILCTISACKKNDTPQTTQQKIQGKWLLKNIVSNDHYANADHMFTYNGTSTDYFDFRSDGKLYYSFSSITDTVTYSLSSDTKILMDGTDLYDIKTLTPNSFIIYKKEFFGTDYEEETISWQK